MTQTPAPVSALDRFFVSLRRSPVVRSPRGRIGGVCAGLAERLDLSVTTVRIAVVVLAVLGPAGALYLVAWLLLPDASGSIRLERALRQGDGSSVALLVVTVLVLISDTGIHARMGWLSLVLVAALIWAVFRAGSRPAGGAVVSPPPSDSEPR